MHLGNNAASPQGIRIEGPNQSEACHTMRFGSTAKVLAKCMLKYYRISECVSTDSGQTCVCGPQVQCYSGCLETYFNSTSPCASISAIFLTVS